MADAEDFRTARAKLARDKALALQAQDYDKADILREQEIAPYIVCPVCKTSQPTIQRNIRIHPQMAQGYCGNCYENNVFDDNYLCESCQQ